MNKDNKKANEYLTTNKVIEHGDDIIMDGGKSLPNPERMTPDKDNIQIAVDKAREIENLIRNGEFTIKNRPGLDVIMVSTVIEYFNINEKALSLQADRIKELELKVLGYDTLSCNEMLDYKLKLENTLHKRDEKIKQLEKENNNHKQIIKNYHNQINSLTVENMELREKLKSALDFIERKAGKGYRVKRQKRKTK
jgi:hypothetical protein